MAKIVKWKNIIVEAVDEEDVRLLDEMVDNLELPFRLVESGVGIAVECCREDTIDVAGLGIPIVYEDYCDTWSCNASVRIPLPEDHPLRPLVKKAVEETWATTVRKVKMSVYGVANIELASDADLETVEARCRGLGATDRKSVFQVPLGTLKRNLEKTLRDREELLKILRDAMKIVEEVEERLKEDREEVDVEFLEKRLRKSYLSILKPGDELDVEF